MSRNDSIKTPKICSSSNRALWSSLTSLQAENSQMKVKIQSLERKSAGEVPLIGGSPSKFLRMELEREKSETTLLRQQLEAVEAKCATYKADLSCMQSKLTNCQEHLKTRDEALALKEVELLAALAESEAKQVEILTVNALHNAEAAALRDQLLAAQQSAEGLEASRKAESRAKDSCLAEAQAKLATAKAELQAMTSKASRQQGEAISLREQLTQCKDTTQRLEAQLQGTKRQLSFTEAELRSTQAAAEATRAAMEELQANHATLNTGFITQIARLEGACQEHCATITKLEGELQRAAASKTRAKERGVRVGEVLGGAESPGPDSEGVDNSGMTLAGSPRGDLHCCGASEPSMVYNVMAASPVAEPCSHVEEESKLTQQVLSLQDKLGDLQQAHEVLLADYGSVTEQLAARQAEVQLARLSPESAQLKQQVQLLQEQVLALQQELFTSRSFNQRQDEGRGLKRSLSRAASSLSQRIGLVRHRKPNTPSLGLLSPDSRSTSLTESLASHSVSNSAGASPLASPSLSPFALMLGSPGEAHQRSKVDGEELALRQQLLEREVQVKQLQRQLELEGTRQGQLQEAMVQQGGELARVQEELVRSQAELEVASRAAQQLTDVQHVATEVQLPTHAGDHAKCREAADTLFKQLWRERLARQKAEFAMEQQQRRQTSDRRSTLSDVDEATLSALQAEAQANDAVSAELQRAKGHQLQLQQRLEVLQLQLAKQNAVLESVRGSPQHTQRPCPTSRDIFAQHNLLKCAEERVNEAELKLAAKERAIAQMKRRERELNQTITQAAELRRSIERQQQEAREALRRRLEQERWEKEKLAGQLHATALAQQELLGGLEVLQALLSRAESSGDGSPQRRGQQQGPSTPGRRCRPSSTTTQETLRHISGLLHVASKRLQALSPRQHRRTGRGGLISPRQDHRALLITAQSMCEGAEDVPPRAYWRSNSMTRLSELMEPASPRMACGGSSGREEGGMPDAHEQEGAESALAGAASTSGIRAAPQEEDDMLQAAPQLTGEEQGADACTSKAEEQAAGGAAGEAQQEMGGQQSVTAGRHSTAMLLQLANSEVSVLGLPESSRRSFTECPSSRSLGAAISDGDRPEPGAPGHSRGCSLSSIGSMGELYLGEDGPSGEDCGDYTPAHTTVQDKEGNARRASFSMPTTSVQLGGEGGSKVGASVAGGGGSPSSPRIKALADRISSGLRRMGVGCGETKTRSGSSTPLGLTRMEGKLRHSNTHQYSKTLLQESSPGKPRRIWL